MNREQLVELRGVTNGRFEERTKDYRGACGKADSHVRLAEGETYTDAVNQSLLSVAGMEGLEYEPIPFERFGGWKPSHRYRASFLAG